MTKKKKYYLYVNTGFARYAPVERTFDSYLDAVKFFEENKEMWGTDKYRIISSKEIEEKEKIRQLRKEKREKAKKKIISGLKTIAKNLATNTTKPMNIKPIYSRPPPSYFESSEPSIEEEEEPEIETTKPIQPGLVRPPNVVKTAKPPLISYPKPKQFRFNPNARIKFNIYRPPVIKLEKKKKKQTSKGGD